MTNFSELGLADPVLSALADEGYATPTPIQAQAIPPLLNGADLLGIAQTGTGKTAAFALPLLTRLFNDKRPAPRRGARVLVLSPTRELAAQIGDSFRTYGRQMNVSVAVVFGGVAHKPQINAMAKGVDVLVATPGRLIDHLETGAVTLEGVEALVLDEADQMLDLGFVRPIRRIVSKLRARRQNLFFSATMPHEIAALAAELLHEPVRVQVTPVATTAERVSQRVIHIEANKKRPFLVDLFADPAMSRTLVFTRTKRGADRVARHLEESGIPAVAIHGNKSQRQREVALDAFRKAKTGVLVATDIAARGIDIDGISHVVNFELPEVPEAYVHRIGRTARAGAKGHAISLCDVEERDLLRAIERVTRQQIPSEDRRNDPSIAAIERTHGATGSRNTGRPRFAGRPERGGRPTNGGQRDGRGPSEGRRDENRAGGRGRSDRSGRPFDPERRDHAAAEQRRDDTRTGKDARKTDGRHAGKPGTGQRNERRTDDRQRKGEQRASQRPRDGERAPWSGEGRKPHRGQGPKHANAHARPSDQRPERARADGKGSRHDGAAVAHVFAAIDGRKPGGGKSRHQAAGQHEGQRPGGLQRRRRKHGAPSRRLETA